MPAGAAIGVATLGGAYLSSEASKEAAGIQAGAAREGQANALAMYNEGRRDLAPYRETGAGAVTTLAKLYGIQTPGNPNPQAFGPEATQAFQNSPDYKFAFDEGNRAVQFSAAAKGALGSGNTLRDLTTFGQGAATQNFQNYAQRLMQLAQMGQGAATNSANFGAQFGQNTADAYGNMGQAQASGVVGSANAWNAGLTGAGNNLALYNALQGSKSAYGPTTTGWDSWTVAA
jgi:hypothetical protein